MIRSFFSRIARKIFCDYSHEKNFILNEAVNFDKRCIFVAIPKTGSTTVRVQIREPGDALIPNPHLDILQIRDTLYAFLLRETLGKNETFPNPDVPTNADVRKRAEEVYQSFFKFAAVRNPWARAVSLYYRNEGVNAVRDIADRMSFEAFCEQHLYASDTCRQPTLHENQYDWLCDEDGALAMDYVYKVENFETAIDEIYERTSGRVSLSNKRLNENPQSPSSNYRECYTQRTRRLIAERFEKDIETFGYTF
ncbi:MAG: sulfotransferase family 2 domain-containing protein [Salinivenus sp.]